MFWIVGLIVLSMMLNKGMEERIMAKVQDLLDAIAAEREEVTGKLSDLKTLVQELKDQIANGGGAITEAQLDEVLTGIQSITTPEDDA